MPASATKGFERKIESLNNELVNFEAIAAKGIESLADTKKAETSWSKIALLMNRINVEIGNLQTDSSEVFPKEIVKSIEAANTALAAYETKLKKVRKSEEYKKKKEAITGAQTARDTAARNYNRQEESREQAHGALVRAELEWNNERKKQYVDSTRQLAEVTGQIEAQTAAYAEQREVLQKLQDKSVITSEGKLSAVFRKRLETVQAEIQKKEESLKIDREAVEEAKALEDQKKKARAAARGKVTKLTQKGVSENDQQLKTAKKKQSEAESEYAAAQKALQTVTAKVEKEEQALANLEKELAEKRGQIASFEGATKTVEDFQELKKQQTVLQTTIEKLEKYRENITLALAALASQDAELEKSRGIMENTESALETLVTDFKNFEIDQTSNEWKILVDFLQKITGIDLSALVRDTEEVERTLEDYKADQIQRVPGVLSDISDTASRAAPNVKRVGETLRKASEEGQSIETARKELDSLKDSILQFFSIGNAIQIFKDAVRSAFETVKELDAAMTETAVVTDFSIGDMWQQLPRYTEAANKLGTTTLGAYETMTLFYQQGLKTNEVFEIGTETMKMARIAGLDYADATDKMTAALRGFNMELDETSARRVNDVYSELAAITAADTEEIANAMTKTASIAHNANMEFETTAAFLSQIIETTRESAETAGTAMKTVIARFQELKKDPSEIGEVDGEIVDANKIEGALRTVGVALRDSTGQFRDLDDVFLELAAKWNDLDTNTQRYIATVAAGSRQQSRFIAMMSDYERTMQLVTAANESAGASQKQFEKTIESLESKLNRLTNAWQQFTMGLANNQVIKWGVDTLTTFLNLLNGITEWSGHNGLGGLITGFNKLAVTMIGLKAGQLVFDSFFLSYSELRKESEGVFQIKNVFKALGESIKNLPSAFESTKKSFTSVKNTLVGGAKKIWDAVKIFGIGKSLLVGGGIIAGFIALGAIFKLIKSNTPEEKLKRAQQAAEQASDAARQAADSFERLNSSLEGIGEGAKKIEELTRGTKEWKKAVQDVNSQMMDLIEQYPELAPFIKSNGGILTIDYNATNSQGQKYEEVYGQIEERKNQASYIEKAMAIEETVASEAVLFKELTDAAKVYKEQSAYYYTNAPYAPGSYHTATAAAVSPYAAGLQAQTTALTADQELTDALAEKILSDPAFYQNDEALANWLGEGSEVAGNFNWEALRDYAQTKATNNETIESLSQGIVSSVLSEMDVTDDQVKVLSGFMSEERSKWLYEDAKKQTLTAEIDLDELAKTLNWTKAGNDYYSGEGEERKKIDWTDEQYKQAYSAIVTGENAKKAYEGFLAAMDKWGTSTVSYTNESGQETAIEAKYLKQLFSDAEGGDLTLAAIEALEAVGENGIEQLYNAGGGATNLGDYDLFEAEYERLIGDARLAFDEVKTQIENLELGEDFEKNIGELSANAASTLLNKLESLGSKDAQKVADKFNQIAEDLDPQTLEDFTTQINAMDWTDLEAWDGLSKKLEELGIEVPTDELREFARVTSNATEAQRQQEFEALSALVGSSSSLASDILERESDDKVFTKEEVDLLRRAAPDAEFVKTGDDEYVYLGDSMNNLAKALMAWGQNLIGTTPAFENATKQEQIDTYTTAYSSMGGSELATIAESDDATQAEAAQKVLDAKIAQEGLQIELEQTAQAAQEAGSAFAENSTRLKSLIIKSNELKKATKTLCETVEDNSDAFSAGNKKIASGEEATKDYYIALRKISDKAKDVFGDVATEEFVQANAAAFEKLTEGGEIGATAFEQIQAAAREATMSALETDTRVSGILTDISSLISQADLDFQVDGYADITDIVQKLIDVGYKAEDAKRILESLLGASVEFKVEYQTIRMPTAIFNSAGYANRADLQDVTNEGAMTSFKMPKRISTTGGAVAVKNTYTGSGYKPSGGSKGGSGGGGSKEEKKWENSYDKLYNLTREINEELRERERIERRYQKLLKAHHTGAQDIVGVSEKELAHLQEEAELQEKLIAGRKQQMNEYLKENSSLAKYANIETNERGEQVLRIDWEAINKVTDEEKGQKIEDYISQLEEWLESIDEANDTLDEIQDTVEEIKERGKDEYFDLEERIKEALTQSYQDQIDELSAINESINDTNSRLIEAMQSSIDKARQDRDNAEKEKEIADKQRQLAYLQQDTSGANDMAILQLQEEISRAQQDRTDALIDQKISELQEQNDKAAEQRQQQIDLAQAQLDHYIASGEIWQEVYGLMSEGLSEENGLVRGSKLEEILKKSETFEGLSEIGQMEWLKELNANVASALAYLKVGRQIENLGLKEGTEITFTTADGKVVKGKMDKQGNVTVDGKTYSDVYQGFDGNYYSDENYEDKRKPVSTTPPPDEKPKESPVAEDWKPSVGGMVKITKGAKFVSGEKVMEAVRAEGVIAGKKGAFKILKDQGNGNFYVGRDWSQKGVTGLINKKYLTKYKTGGLADFTGPAWLDGTKSKPEMVLNARDTQNFIQLKDILSNILSRASGGSTTENNGDYTYDIDINVEKIGSDYDLDQIASKLRSMITNASQYRNNNTIGLKR